MPIQSTQDPTRSPTPPATSQAALGNPWEQQFLKDVGAPDSQGNVNFLNAWINREGASGFANNPLATQEGGYGGTPGTNGIMSYPTVQQGAAADAAALENGRYNDVLGALRAGTANPNATYSSLGTWSGGGYTSLAGTSTNPAFVNPNGGPALAYANQNQNLLNYGSANSAQLASQNAAYASQETGFQQQLLGLSEQQLGIQVGALGRQETLDPKLHGLQMQEFGLQQKGLVANRADIQRQGLANIAGTQSQQAGSGTMFTSGGRTGLSNVRADLASSLSANQRSQQSLHLQEETSGLQFNEQMSALRDQGQNLAITAKRYGISKEELQARLTNSLQNINAGNVSTQLGFQQEGLNNTLQLSQALATGAPISAMTGGLPSNYTNNPSFSLSGTP